MNEKNIFIIVILYYSYYFNSISLKRYMYKNLNRSLEVGIYKLSMTFSESIKRIAYKEKQYTKADMGSQLQYK